jgi:hypothetical protein
MNTKLLFSAGLVLLLGSGLFQPFKPEVPEARADESVALIQPGETGPMLPTTEASAILADFSPYRWHTFYEGGGLGSNIAVGEDGSVFITSNSEQSWLGDGNAEPLHPFNQSPLNDSDLSVLKLDSEGAYQWHTIYGGGSRDYGTSIAIAGDGSVYITGSSEQSWLGDGGAEPLHPFTPALDLNYSDLFVLKLDSEGAYQWHTFYGSDALWYDGSNDIAVGKDGSVYITGSSGSWLGDGDVQPFHPFTSSLDANYGDLFVLKLDSEGAYQWHTFYGGEWGDYGSGIAIVGDGSVYITGSSWHSWLGDGEGEPLHPYSMNEEITVLKLDSEGAYQWHTFYGGEWGDYGSGIAIGGDGSIYVTGFSGGPWQGESGAEPLHPYSGYFDITVLKLDGEGAYQWHTFYGSDAQWHDRGHGITVSVYGGIYITGYSDTSWLGDGEAEPLHPYSMNDDITVLKLDGEGAYQWHTFYGGEWGDYGSGISIAGDGSVYITGGSGGPWQGESGAEPLHPYSGYYGLFVLKLGIIPLVTLDSTPNPSDIGQVVTFTATVTSTASLIPTGVVTFTDGLTVLGTGMLNTSGVAVFETSALAAGVHTITAEYGGDDQFSGSSSSPLVHTVQEIDQTRRIYLPLLSR